LNYNSHILVKQIKSIIGKDIEREYDDRIIRSSIMFSMLQVIEASVTMEYDLEEENREIAQEILERPDKIKWSADTGDQIKRLWNDAAIQKAYMERCEFQLDESLIYFMNKIEQISDPNWAPTHEDIIRARQKTTGVNNLEIKTKAATIKLIDVGGQRRFVLILRHSNTVSVKGKSGKKFLKMLQWCYLLSIFQNMI
jgi:hypothetical protein